MHRYSTVRVFSIKILMIYGLMFSIFFASGYFYIQNKDKNIDQISTGFLEQFYKLPKFANPKPKNSYRIYSSSQEFESVPLQLSIFSDFQCSACKGMEDVIPRLIGRYKGKLNIQYLFYPLDHNCNTSLKRPMHTSACEVSYVAACNIKNFTKIHDEIFSSQGEINSTWVQKLAKKYSVEECSQSPETKTIIKEMLDIAKLYNIKSTPTIIINGVKIEGILPIKYYYIILDDLLKKAN